MGGQQSKDVNMKTPLGCILKHWKDLGGIPGGNISKKTLLKYCTQWWPLYKLDDNEKWPPEGTTNYNTILQLMLFLRWLNKWDEVMYADMFFTLRNKPEWQKECGVNVAPQDPLVLALEKDKKGSKPKERCCDACSIGQQCLKLTRRDSGKESEISLWEYHPFAPGREGPLPRPKEEQGDPSPLKELDQWWKSRFGHSPQKLDNSWGGGTPLKSGIGKRDITPQGLDSPQGLGSYMDANSPPRLELEGGEGSPSGAESRRETRSLPELSPYGDNNTPRSGGVCRIETSTPRTGDKSNSLESKVSRLRGDVSEVRYSGENSETWEKEAENNSQKLNIVIQIEDKRDGGGAEDEKDSSPGRDRGRLDCVVKIEGEKEEPEGGKRKEKRKNKDEEDPGEGTSHSYYTTSVARGEARQREEGNHSPSPANYASGRGKD